MRHLRGIESIEVPLVSRSVEIFAGLGLLIAAPRSANRFASRRLGAEVAAIPIAVVTPTAQEEHLPATGTAHES